MTHRWDAANRARGFQIFLADPDDAAAIADLFHRSFTATFGHLYAPEDLEGFLGDWTEDRFRKMCLDPDFSVFVGEDPEGRLLGYCMMGPQDLGIHSDQSWWVLRQLYLEENAKGTGLAEELVNMGIAESFAREIAEIYLTVWVNNHRARRFYERRGFIEVGSYAFRVGNTVDDDRILKLALWPAEC